NRAFVDRTIENNVHLTIDRIRKKSPILKEMEDNGEIAMIGAVYKLSSGRVQVLT
ncbi:MAG: carbonic anhydrase, partial [Bacteroidia bacterium]|nr:carbonic anhydrase [Bacteroidia bacterium]